MNGKGIIALAVSFIVALGIAPAMALATAGSDSDSLMAATAQLQTQAHTDLGSCTIKWTGGGYVGGDTDIWQMFYAKGKDASVTPAFDLYLGSEKVDPSNYIVSYQLSYWDDAADEEIVKPWNKPLVPSASPVASNEDMSSEYRIVATAKSGSGYSGTFNQATAIVVDFYNFGRNMDVYPTKATSSMRYAINPMNHNYYIIPQAKAESVLKSLAVYAGRAPGEGGMVHVGGTKVAKEYYTVAYYRAKKDSIAESAIVTTGKALSKMPTTAGSYLMVIEGKNPYYGTSTILFDIQDKMSKATVAKVGNQKYTGKAVKPKLKVTYAGNTLSAGVDYTVTYKNNVKAGTAKAIIKGCNKVQTNDRGTVVTVNKQRFFAGSKTVKFKIVK